MTGSSEGLYGIVAYGGREVRILPGHTLTIGRTPGNGLVLPVQSVSRTHAAIRWAQGAAYPELLDLGSHNGTTVNGRGVSLVPVRLTGGERIRVADRALDFSLLFPGSEALLEDDSEVVALFTERRDVLKGTLPSALDLGALVAVLELEERTGTLTLRSGSDQEAGCLTFCLGRVMSARKGAAKSTRALELLILAPGTCHYRFTTDLEPCETGMTLLLSNYLRRWVSETPPHPIPARRRRGRLRTG